MRIAALFGAFSLFLLAFLQGEAESRGWFSIKEIELEGSLSYITEHELNLIYDGFLGQSLLFSSVSDLSRKASEPAWVNSVSVRKIWPNKLRFVVGEEVPVANWREGQVITAQGGVISPSALHELPLPSLQGPKGTSQTVLEQFRLVSQVLTNSDLKVDKLELEERGAWNVYFSNGLLVKLGRDEILSRLQRFIAVYKSDLSGRMARIHAIDARYPHGIAVIWKKIAE
ncbi:cell division protein FtsQ [Marinomonas sp. SBI22]|uniref:cell division protein FtsQ/DivIB n=1 Tax=unclassified Marinomonas TaxID=196814 RepID=UPI0007AF4241|nr:MULTISPECIES: cell division protein FtsQ/DivIB [unclassified Marinomonas]KZM39087.1 cell division protein FtsQ [Marinomonas sp. SBI22]KZM39871.1 cell division protein FtsQ [Marinomonas sp. SBI8L]